MADSTELDLSRHGDNRPVLDDTGLEQLALNIRQEISLPKPDIDNIVHVINNNVGHSDAAPQDVIAATLIAHLPPGQEESAKNVAHKLSGFIEDAITERDHQGNDNMHLSSEKPSGSQFKL